MTARTRCPSVCPHATTLARRQNADGVVGAAEFHKVLQKMNPEATIEMAREMVATGDKDGDGALSQAEFCDTFWLAFLQKGSEALQDQLQFLEGVLGLAAQGQPANLGKPAVASPRVGGDVGVELLALSGASMALRALPQYARARARTRTCCAHTQRRSHAST